MSLQRLSRAFYLRPTLDVARDLLGKYLVRQERNTRLSGRIVEVEAYMGTDDPASHAYRGPSPRNEVMFGIGGHLYVYFTYGMHFCCNVVTEARGIGHAVLLRALEPREGIVKMAERRGIEFSSNTPEVEPRKLVNLCNGPGKLCQAFGIARKENGIDLTRDEVWIGEKTKEEEQFTIASTTRVGISAGKEPPWRFFIEGNRFVSKGKPV